MGWDVCKKRKACKQAGETARKENTCIRVELKKLAIGRGGSRWMREESKERTLPKKEWTREGVANQEKERRRKKRFRMSMPIGTYKKQSKVREREKKKGSSGGIFLHV